MRLRPLPDGSLDALGLPARLTVTLTAAASFARVLPSLLGPSPSGVCHLSRICSSVGGPVGVAHSSIPRSFLVVALSASAVGFADALWICPERALRLFLRRSRW